jgi:hypothetical protein
MRPHSDLCDKTAEAREEIAERAHSLAYVGMLRLVAFSDLCRDLENASIDDKDNSQLLTAIEEDRRWILDEVEFLRSDLPRRNLAA